jgi:hypothetical protein
MGPHKSDRLLRVGPPGPALFCYRGCKDGPAEAKKLENTGTYGYDATDERDHKDSSRG